MRSLKRLGALCAVALWATLVWSGAASAQEGTSPDPGAYVGGTTTIATTPANPAPEQPSEVAGASITADSSEVVAQEVQSSTLAFTGGDVLTLSLLGAGAVLVGSFAVAARRRDARTAQ